MFNTILFVSEIESAQVRKDIARAVAGSAWGIVASECHRIAATSSASDITMYTQLIDHREADDVDAEYIVSTAIGDAMSKAGVIESQINPDGEVPNSVVDLPRIANIAQWASTAGECQPGAFGSQEFAFKAACEAHTINEPRATQLEMLKAVGLDIPQEMVQRVIAAENARSAVYAEKRSANSGRAANIYDMLCADECECAEDAAVAFARLSVERRAAMHELVLRAIKRCEDAVVAAVLTGRSKYSIADYPIIKKMREEMETA